MAIYIPSVFNEGEVEEELYKHCREVDKKLKEIDKHNSLDFLFFLNFKYYIVSNAAKRVGLKESISFHNDLYKKYKNKSTAKELRELRKRLKEVEIRLELLTNMIPNIRDDIEEIDLEADITKILDKLSTELDEKEV